ncbi:MAG TPA: hypothetical protein VHK70_04595 [Burkholderiaceae bacterium]|nr:hypothetical protein [Burkholderiaceae bacterium]
MTVQEAGQVGDVVDRQRLFELSLHQHDRFHQLWLQCTETRLRCDTLTVGGAAYALHAQRFPDPGLQLHTIQRMAQSQHQIGAGRATATGEPAHPVRL